MRCLELGRTEEMLPGEVSREQLFTGAGGKLRPRHFSVHLALRSPDVTPSSWHPGPAGSGPPLIPSPHSPNQNFANLGF